MTPNKPKRIQRKRTKGWRMPPNTVYVGRPSIWGNDFTVDKLMLNGHAEDRTQAAAIAVLDFDQWLRHGDPHDFKYRMSPEQIYDLYLKRRNLLGAICALEGKDLACWCPLDQPCHADVLLELANDDPK